MSRQTGVIGQALASCDRHSTIGPSPSAARTIAPMRIASGGRASRIPPPLPRTVSITPASASWCTTFIRWLRETP